MLCCSVAIQPLGRRLLTRNDHIDVVAAPEAVIDNGEQGVRVRWQIDADNVCLLVHHMIDEARVLVAEAIVILAPDMGGQEIGERGDRLAPSDLAGNVQPLGVLVEHRVHNVDEGFVAGEEAMAAGEQVALEPALAEVFAENLHHPPVRRDLGIAGNQIAREDPIGDFEHRPEPV